MNLNFQNFQMISSVRFESWIQLYNFQLSILASIEFSSFEFQITTQFWSMPTVYTCSPSPSVFEYAYVNRNLKTVIWSLKFEITIEAKIESWNLKIQLQLKLKVEIWNFNWNSSFQIFHLKSWIQVSSLTCMKTSGIYFWI